MASLAGRAGPAIDAGSWRRVTRVITRAFAAALVCATLVQAAWASERTVDNRDYRPAGRGEIVGRAVADVTGDGTEDEVLLLAHEPVSGGPYRASHTVAVKDGRDGSVHQVWLGEQSGARGASLSLVRVTGGSGSQVLVALPTGGSGGIVYYVLLGIDDGVIRPLFNGLERFNGAELDVQLRDGYVARIESRELGSIHTVALGDLSLYNAFYSETGRLIEPVSGVADPLGLARAEDVDGDGTAELIGYQSVWVLFHANSIAWVRTVWDWDGEEMVLTRLDVLLPGEPLR